MELITMETYMIFIYGNEPWLNLEEKVINAWCYNGIYAFITPNSVYATWLD